MIPTHHRRRQILTSLPWPFRFLLVPLLRQKGWQAFAGALILLILIKHKASHPAVLHHRSSTVHDYIFNSAYPKAKNRMLVVLIKKQQEILHIMWCRHRSEHSLKSFLLAMQNDVKEATFKQYVSQTEEKLAQVQVLLSNQSQLIDQVSSQVGAAETAALSSVGQQETHVTCLCSYSGQLQAQNCT